MYQSTIICKETQNYSLLCAIEIKNHLSKFHQNWQCCILRFRIKSLFHFPELKRSPLGVGSQITIALSNQYMYIHCQPQGLPLCRNRALTFLLRREEIPPLLKFVLFARTKNQRAIGVELLFDNFSTLCTISMIFIKRFVLLAHILYLRMYLSSFTSCRIG